MEIQSPRVTPKAIVRWPFQMLAALIVLVGLLAIVGGAVAGWTRGGPWSKWQLLATLPAILWLIGFAWSAAVHGKSPLRPAWPFASDRVLMFYWLVWVIVYFI